MVRIQPRAEAPPPYVPALRHAQEHYGWLSPEALDGYILAYRDVLAATEGDAAEDLVLVQFGGQVQQGRLQRKARSTAREAAPITPVTATKVKCLFALIR